MKNLPPIPFFFLFCAALGLNGCAHSPRSPQVALAPLPAWAMDFASDDLYLDIGKLTKTENLTRREAIETQAFYREALTRDPALDRTRTLQNALERVRTGETVSGWKPVVFNHPADFVLVLDLDETLLHQWYGSGKDGFFDLKGVHRDGTGYEGVYSGTYVKFTPGAETFIRAMKKNPHCKSIVVFTGKVAPAARDILARWSVRDAIDGIFSRDHLVVGDANATASKDLRIFDPKLEHVVLVDDNPGRVLQPKVLRAMPKFDADRYSLAMKNRNREILKHYETLFGPIEAEINESVSAAGRLRIPFSQAYLPYSYAGERVYRSLKARLKSEARALDGFRRNPELLSAAFVPQAQEDAPKSH